MTALPLVVGHAAYERIVEKHKGLQVAVIALAVVLCFAGLYQLAAARKVMVGKAAAAAPSATSSYVDGAPQAEAGSEDQKAGGDTEAKVRETLGLAMLLIMLATELMLGFLVGVLTKLHTDHDFSAWRELREIKKRITRQEETVSKLESAVEIVKRDCAAGILRAQVVLRKRRVPYHRVLTAFIFFVLLGAAASRAQTIERYEGILIDTSGSISQGGATDLFKEYLTATKKLLLTEIPNTRVWVSSITVDSFGGEGALLKGWTPDARGVFTDQLDRARRQLASAFEQKSSGLSPMATGTDIFGALWRFKALFESAGNSPGVPKTIWIFSDMVNETRSFPMPNLIATGPEHMLERAKANGLVVPLTGYKLYIYGATPTGLAPQAWLAVKNFWTLYFQAAGAELVTYSAECDVQR